MDGSLKLTLGVIAGSLILIGAIVGAASFMDKPDQVDTAQTLGADTVVKGNSDSSITIVEFSDFQCPACKIASSEIKKFYGDFADQVGFAYRHMPLPQHSNAKPAAHAVESAAKQNKFWEVHDWLFEHQDELTDATTNAEYFYGQFGEEFGLDEDQFMADYQSDQVRERVAQDVADARSLGVNSTPTFFINGEKSIGSITYERLVEITGVEVAATED